MDKMTWGETQSITNDSFQQIETAPFINCK